MAAEECEGKAAQSHPEANTEGRRNGQSHPTAPRGECRMRNWRAKPRRATLKRGTSLLQARG